jgi:hypothetical protein
VSPIRLVTAGVNVSEAAEQLDAHPEEWNTHTLRTEAYGTPHGGISDIWVRYNDFAHFDGDGAKFNGPHDSVWYPVADKLPAIKALAEQVYAIAGGKTLGGVLITRIPPGGIVKPHVDSGWHAAHYEKFAVQIKGNGRQAFCFDDAKLRTYPGDVFTFDNSHEHWVVNESAGERITMIVCLTR